MVAQRTDYIQSLALCPSPSGLQLADARHDEAEMVERARIRVARRTAVERDIVASRAQVGVVRIGLPYQAHPEHARVDLGSASDVADPEREMAHAAIGNHCRSLR